MAILSDAEMAQLFHSIDLTYYSATTASGKQQAQQAGLYAEDLLAQNMVANAPKTNTEKILIHGVPIPREAVFSVAKANIQHFRAKDEHFSKQQIQEVAQRTQNILPLKARIQKDIDLINESGGLNYYRDSNNLPAGVSSYLPPKKVSDIKGSDWLNITAQPTPNIWNYTQQAFEGKGQGQDVEMRAADLSFDTRSSEFRKFLFDNRAFSGAYTRYLKTGLPQPVNIETIQLPTYDIFLQQQNVLGKVKLKMDGYILTEPNGKPVFLGTIEQGKNAEVFTFPKGNRVFYKEMPTTIGRHSSATQFRTFFIGKKPVWIDL